MSRPARPGFTPWRNALALPLYGLAVTCVLFGIVLAWAITSHKGANAAIGDNTGLAMGLSFVVGWLMPLGIGAAGLAVLLRWPTRPDAEGETLAFDRRWMRSLGRRSAAARTGAAWVLAGAALAIVGFVLRLSADHLAAAIHGGRLADTLQVFLLLYGPLLLLALACGSLAWRLLRRAAPAPGAAPALC